MNQVCITGAPPSLRFPIPPVESFVDEDDSSLVYDFREAPELREIGPNSSASGRGGTDENQAQRK